MGFQTKCSDLCAESLATSINSFHFSATTMTYWPCSLSTDTWPMSQISPFLPTSPFYLHFFSSSASITTTYWGTHYPPLLMHCLYVFGSNFFLKVLYSFTRQQCSAPIPSQPQVVFPKGNIFQHFQMFLWAFMTMFLKHAYIEQLFIFQFHKLCMDFLNGIWRSISRLIFPFSYSINIILLQSVLVFSLCPWYYNPELRHLMCCYYIFFPQS